MARDRKIHSDSLGTTRPPSIQGLRVLVAGLGRFGGGVGVVRWLIEQGAAVTVTDIADSDALAESIEAIADLDVTLRLGGHDPRDLNEIDLVVINPAINKACSEFFRLIQRRGLRWTTEINLFCARCPCTIIGVTGSYGKSTTCAMLAEVLRACHDAGGVGFTGVHLGGNIGRSLLADLPRIRPSDLVVLELSNAQLEDLPRIDWAPPIAVITNLWPHHLDRYGSFEAYARAKLNIVGDPRRWAQIIVGELDLAAEAMLAQRVPDSEGRVIRVRAPKRPIALRIPGRHNQANAACVLTLCRQLDLNETVARESLAGFVGLPHRLQHVRTLDGVDYFNDSKSTSPAATEAAVASLDRPIVAIVGGQEVGCISMHHGPDDRSGGKMRQDAPGPPTHLARCAALLAEACRAVICIGPSGPAWAEAVRAAAGPSGGPVVDEAGGLDVAVPLAQNAAKPGDVVLFSPGAPSFDAYPNFAARGAHFLELVHALP